MATLAPDDRRLSVNRRSGRSGSDGDHHVAQRLKAARLRAGLSQEKAAEALGLTFQQVQKYEKGTNRVACGRLALLAKLYNRPIAWFFEGIEDAGIIYGSGDPLAEVLSAPHGLRLINSFIEIGNREHQRAVADFAETLSKV